MAPFLCYPIKGVKWKLKCTLVISFISIFPLNVLHFSNGYEIEPKHVTNVATTTIRSLKKSKDGYPISHDSEHKNITRHVTTKKNNAETGMLRIV